MLPVFMERGKQDVNVRRRGSQKEADRVILLSKEARGKRHNQIASDKTSFTLMRCEKRGSGWKGIRCVLESLKMLFLAFKRVFCGRTCFFLWKSGSRAGKGEI